MNWLAKGKTPCCRKRIEIQNSTYLPTYLVSDSTDHLVDRDDGHETCHKLHARSSEAQCKTSHLYCLPVPDILAAAKSRELKHNQARKLFIRTQLMRFRVQVAAQLHAPSSSRSQQTMHAQRDKALARLIP